MSTQYIFFYGTLMCAEVYEAITGKPLVAENATLSDFKIYSLQNRAYPGIIPSKDSEVRGLVTKVGQETLDRLDCFEGEEYHRTLVEVTSTTGNIIKSWAYVLKESHRSLAEMEGWDYEKFLKVHLENYLL
ncbi:gamma-glutamylcyclotransferase family protein [Reichenbachiella sp. MALMAid0571]|uniref:gamma-glutamylcyclotransferase family protein n=1 Tax=Reichenbachiella sp. MALMAid0571 TaxID=3143939 RepID=UPI0032DF0B91